MNLKRADDDLLTVSAQVSQLNVLFKSLSPIDRIRLLYKYFPIQDVLMTSSFGTQSALLLYWMSNLQPQQPIHFLDTGYHFEETLAYKKQLTQAFGLNVVNIFPEAQAHQKTLDAEMWRYNSNQCCHVNKVTPLKTIQLDYKIWISGLMSYQSPFRRNLEVFEEKANIIKFYPLIDVTEEAFENYYQQADLPVHPLQVLGYHSIGCLHCTQRGKGRSGRWANQQKTECGLHF